MLPYAVISTGSKGNAVIVNKRILVDCGVPYKALRPYVPDLALVLLTHRHGDHFNPGTVKRLAADRPLVRFGCCAWMIPLLVASGVPSDRIDLYSIGGDYSYGAFRVQPVHLRHDVPNCGYMLRFADGRKAFYATDTNSLDGIEAPNFDLYLVEANYVDEQIRERIAEHKANGEYVYERRVLETHLSKADCDAWAFGQMAPWSTLVYLHCHQEEAPANEERS